jgi:hypothetical protein
MASKDKETASRYVWICRPIPATPEAALRCHGHVCGCRPGCANQEPRSDATLSNPRGIPYAPFVDKVEDYVTTRADVEPTLRRFQEMIA